VVALIAADDFRPAEIPNFDLVLPRQLQCGLNGFRSAAGKVNRAAAEVWSGEIEERLGVFFRNGSTELAAMNELQRTGLQSWLKRSRRCHAR